ncbi:MAG: arginine--tRNA ligase, partial [Lentisphaerae bacterium]|nr:arginine--tRNA ligase [Lentisphaerota bacterium]
METIERMLSIWIQQAFQKAFPYLPEGTASIGVTVSTSPEFGDYQSNAAMLLAKQLRKPPRDVARLVLEQAGAHPAIRSVSLAGPGFINMTLHASWLAGQCEAMLADGRLRVPAIGQGRGIVMDYSSPNVAKPMHIGHIRSTVIGSALDRLHRFLGYTVVSDNHIGDWGTQFGILIKGYRHFVDEKALAEWPVEELERLYVKSYEESKKNADWLEACRQELVKLQAGDPENLALWQRFIALSLEEFGRMYRRLGIAFDLVRGESFYRDQVPAVIRMLEEKGLARESEGALVVFLDEEKLPVCIVRKSDGASNYATTDIATLLGREKEFAPETIVYVTDERQQLHFRQLFAIGRKLG